MSIHAYKATTCRWASRQQQEQQAYIHFLISLYIEKAARNTGTQHLIFWTQKSKICWVVLDHHHRKKNRSYLLSPNLHFIKVSANHDQIFVENKTAMESSSFFFCAKSIKHVWGVGIEKTMAMENHQSFYKCVHIYMSLQNYCKWSGIYFCSVVCFEKNAPHCCTWVLVMTWLPW